MGLVDYSDSEGSDAEPSPAPAPTAPKTTITSKSGFQKVVDKSNPRRIKVDLPSATKPDASEDAGIGAEDDSRPAKRARTGGAFGGFNSFLPAPKNPGKSVTGSGSGSGPASGLLSSRGPGLGRGVNLRTGAAPAFSRAPPPEEEYQEVVENESQTTLAAEADAPSSEMRQDEALPDVPKDVPPAKKTAMFRPLSVGNKKKKKPIAATAAVDAASASASASHTSQASIQNVTRQPTAPTPKRSLFGDAEAEADTAVDSTSDGNYKPFFEDATPDEPPPEDSTTSAPTNPPSNQPQTLNDLAATLNLTPAERRQLFGRNPTATSSTTPITSFSVSDEYAHNRAMAASAEAQAAAAPKTVRSIAPGKHSLQQLLNQASSQKDALEESFAQGRRNRAEGAGRYGW